MLKIGISAFENYNKPIKEEHKRHIFMKNNYFSPNKKHVEWNFTFCKIPGWLWKHKVVKTYYLPLSAFAHGVFFF